MLAVLQVTNAGVRRPGYEARSDEGMHGAWHKETLPHKACSQLRRLQGIILELGEEFQGSVSDSALAAICNTAMYIRRLGCG